MYQFLLAVLAVRCFCLGLIPADSVGWAGSRNGDFPTLWETDTETFLESGPTVADIRGETHEEVLLAAREELIVLGPGGTPLWKWKSASRLMTYPAVLPRKDRTALVYVADMRGRFVCLDGDGQMVWETQLPGLVSWSCAVVCDLESDGSPEVIQTDGQGGVWVFEAFTGKVVWKSDVDGIPVSPAVGDLDGDGREEVVLVTGNGKLIVLDDMGTLSWERTLGGSSQTWGTSAPVIFVDSDGVPRVLAASSTGRLYCFSPEGDLVWKRAVRGPVASTLSVGDLDMDGTADLFLVTQTGFVYRFDEWGRLIWEIDTQGRSLAAGAIVDVNGDGNPEYTLCTQTGHLMVFNRNGEVVHDHQFPHRTINVTPAFGDVEPESPGLEMVLSGGEIGKVYCYGTAAGNGEPVQWAAYRGNEQKTGFWNGFGVNRSLRMVPDGLGRDRLHTSDEISFLIFNPTGKNLKATAACNRPDGSRQMAATRVVGRKGILRLPVTLSIPGTYEFRWSLEDDSGKPLFASDKKVPFLPFVSDRATIVEAIQNLRETAEEVESMLPSSSTALRNRSRSLERRLEAVRSRLDSLGAGMAAEAEAGLEEVKDLVDDSERAVAIAELVRQTADDGPGTGLIPFFAALWENREVEQQVPSFFEPSLSREIRAVRGEHVPVSIGLFNRMARTVQAQIRIETNDSNLRVRCLSPVPVVTSVGETSWDPLPRLEDPGILRVSPLSTRELWLDIDTADLAAGTHAVKVRIRVLNGAGVVEGPSSPHSIPPPEDLVGIRVRILPFEMAPSGKFRLCTWATLDREAVKDMLAHGGNVFIAPHASPLYGDDGELTGFDTTRLDGVIEMLRGQDVILLINGIPSFRSKLGTEEYGKDLDRYLEFLVPHLAAAGIDRDHFAFYPIDEAGGIGWSAVNRLIEFGKEVRRSDPGIMMYLDGGGDPAMFRAMAPYVDIWCPGISMLAEETPVMELIRSTGKHLWSYDCSYRYARPVGANLKNINIVGQYRTAALFAFRHGATGIGYWCYNIGEDPWERIRDEYPLVYPGHKAPVTSRRWEAVREGIEDSRILAALREKLAEGKLDPDAEIETRKLLDETLPEMVDRSYEEARLGLARYVLDFTNNDRSIQRFRRKMLDCVEKVTGGS